LNAKERKTRREAWRIILYHAAHALPAMTYYPSKHRAEAKRVCACALAALRKARDADLRGKGKRG